MAAIELCTREQLAVAISVSRSPAVCSSRSKCRCQGGYYCCCRTLCYSAAAATDSLRSLTAILFHLLLLRPRIRVCPTSAMPAPECERLGAGMEHHHARHRSLSAPFNADGPVDRLFHAIVFLRSFNAAEQRNRRCHIISSKALVFR